MGLCHANGYDPDGGTLRAVGPPEGTQVNADLSERVLATICFSIESYDYSLAQEAKTATETWRSLKTAFQESGRKGGGRVCGRDNIELDEIGFKLDDERLSLILLMDLPR